MKRIGLIAAVLSVATLAGCNAQKQHSMALQNAQISLQQQFPERAELQLDKADQIARDNHIQAGVESHVLRAEALLQMGRVDEAQRIAQEIATLHVPGTSGRAQAEELLAKVAIRQGRFLDAQLNLSEADRSYTNPSDKARITDLLSLVRGLEAWSSGRTTAARTHWDSIIDEDLRSSVLAQASGK